jgi:histidinol-phosphate aminotransferase
MHGLNTKSIPSRAVSIELIGAVMNAYAGLGDQILAPAYANGFFRTIAQTTQADYCTASESEITVSLSALLDAVRPQTKTVCVATPGNPTGTHIASKVLRDLRAQLQSDTLLIIDEAYGEFLSGKEPLFCSCRSS